MCEFPSWIVDKDGKAHWAVDADIVAAIEDGKLKSWDDATGHNALEKMFGIKGKHCEGREGLPAGFASDIRAGKCNRMAKVEPAHALKFVPDLLPPGLQLWGAEVKGDLDLRGCDLKGITLPTSVGGGLDLRGCDLKGITLPTSVGGGLDLSGCDLKGITLPTSVGGGLGLRGCDLKGITLPTSVGGGLDLRGCDLKGITLPTSVGGWLDLSGCDLKGITLPTSVGGGLDLEGAKNITLPVGLTIGGNLDLTRTDVESLPHGFSIKGEIIGKKLPIPPKDEPKRKKKAVKAKRPSRLSV